MKIKWDSEGVLGKTVNNDLLAEGHKKVESYLREKLNGRVVSAWIFGSRARSEMVCGSDIDILLIVDKKKGLLIGRKILKISSKKLMTSIL